MTLVPILNQPDELTQYSQSNVLYHVNLGINPFFNMCHVPVLEGKNMRIYLSGQVSHFINNILWNQYFSNTLLKEAYHLVNQFGSSEDTFLKINGKTYRLGECLKWNSAKKFRNDIEKCRSFSVEGFLNDGTMRQITFEMGHLPNYESFDLTFVYSFQNMGKSVKKKNSKSELQSMCSTGRKRYNSTNRQKKMKKSNFDLEMEKKKEEKRKIVYTSSSATKSNIKGSNFSYKNNGRGNQHQSYFQIDKSETLTPYPSSKKSKVTVDKEKVASQILYNKQKKVKTVQLLNEQLEIKMGYKLAQQEEQHKIQIQGIKNEVEEVLNKYGKKNKELQKQNSCLNDLNLKLMKNVDKAELKVQKLSHDLIKIQKEKQLLVSENKKYENKVDQLTQEQIQLKEEYSEEKKGLVGLVKEKERKMGEYKRKYDQMVENMRKLVSVGMTEMVSPLCEKQNNF